jgi:heme exporter protein B
VLIFGVAATEAAIAGEPFGTPFKLLVACALFGFVIGPITAAAAIRLARS